MSKPRIFQHKVGGYTVTESIAVLHPEEYDEVQVVPLDAIVIRRDELPEVTPIPVGFDVEGHVFGSGPAHRRHAVRQLAVAEYLREHPPVDAGQVMALAEALEAEWFPDDPDRATVLARRLVPRGVRVEAKS